MERVPDPWLAGLAKLGGARTGMGQDEREEDEEEGEKEEEDGQVVTRPFGCPWDLIPNPS